MTDLERPVDDAGGLREPPVREVVREDRGIVVRLGGELDLYNADAVRQALFDAAADAPERIVVDLEHVSFLDSTALGVLIEARTQLENRRAFLLAAPQLETQRALEVSGLDRHFGMHATVGEALATTL